MTATVRRRPRRTAEARETRWTEEFTNPCLGCRPALIQARPEMSAIESVKAIVDAYVVEARSHAAWRREEFTSTGRRKSGKALETVLARPYKPSPKPPFRGYARPEAFSSWPIEVQEMWMLGAGEEMWIHSRWDENGRPLNRAAEMAHSLDREERDEYLERRAGRG
jgi:hypothetical protein